MIISFCRNPVLYVQRFVIVAPENALDFAPKYGVGKEGSPMSWQVLAHELVVQTL